MPTPPETPGNPLEQLLDAAQRAELEKTYKALTGAVSEFNKLINEQKVSLTDAVKQFYSAIDSTAQLRKSFGDLNAISDSSTEKMQLLSGAISDAEQFLKTFNGQVKDNADAQAKTAASLSEATAKLNKYNEILDKNADVLIQIKNLEEEIEGIARSDVTDKEAKKLAAQERRTQLLKNQEQLAIILEEYDVEELENDKKKLEDQQKYLQNQQKILEHTKQQALENLPLLNYENQRVKAVSNINDYMGSIVNRITSGAERSNIFGSAMLAIQKSIDGSNGGIKEITKNITDGLAKSLLDPEKAFNRVFNLINDKLIQSTLKFDETLAKVGQSAGGFRKEFEGVAMNMGGVSFVALSQYGVTLEKFGQAYQGLSRAIGGFNNMLDSQRKLLTENAAGMNSLGVSADAYGKLVSKFMGAIGKTAEGSRDMINSLAKDAIALGKSVGEYTSQFESAMSRISGYGREAIRIFKELEAVSAATKGVVTSQDLLSISDKFKDFEGAADSVSKLNAILGGTSVNILDMMKADPAEQIMMIKRAAGEAGLEFDKLNIGYKRLLAEYFGGDINKAQAFFNANISEAQSLMDKAVESEKELEERKQNNIAFQEKLNALIDNMKVSLTPVLNALGYVVGLMTKLMSFPGAPLIATFGMIGGAIVLARVAIDRVIERIMAKVAAVQSAAAATQAAANTETAATERQTAAIQQQTQVIRQNTAEKTQNANAGAKGAGGLLGSVSPGLKTAGAYAGLAAITMGLGFGLRQLSSNYEESRQERIEKRRTDLKIEEMEAEKRLFGSAITPRNMEASFANDLFVVNGREYKLDEKDKFYSLNNIVPGAFGFGVEGGPIAQAATAKMEAANTGLASSVAAKETTKAAAALTNAPPPATAGGNQISSNTEKTSAAPVNINLKAYLQLNDNKVSELAVVLKDYEITKAV